MPSFCIISISFKYSHKYFQIRKLGSPCSCSFDYLAGMDITCTDESVPSTTLQCTNFLLDGSICTKNGIDYTLDRVPSPNGAFYTDGDGTEVLAGINSNEDYSDGQCNLYTGYWLFGCWICSYSPPTVLPTVNPTEAPSSALSASPSSGNDESDNNVPSSDNVPSDISTPSSSDEDDNDVGSDSGEDDEESNDGNGLYSLLAATLLLCG